jgi:hypothetical protein
VVRVAKLLSKIMPRLPPLVPVVVLACLLGCTMSGPEIVPFGGIITHNGQPVPNVRILFQPSQGRASWAISDENGRFALEYDGDHKGAKVDSHTVYVVDEGASIDPTAALAGVARKKRAPELAEAIARHAPEKSKLQVEVKKADRNFQLKLD